MTIAQNIKPPAFDAEVDATPSAYPTLDAYRNGTYTAPASVPATSTSSTAGTPAFSETVSVSGTRDFDAVNWDMPFYNVWIDFFQYSLFLTLLCLGAATYAYIRIRQIRHAENLHLDHMPPGLAMSMFVDPNDSHGHGGGHVEASHGHEVSTVVPADIPAAIEQAKPMPNSAFTPRWKLAQEHAQSQNPNDWRQAIMEADILLDELVTAKGYQGDGLGEKMKTVDRADWNTIDLAWDAHKVRNKIAHEGAAAPLDEREVRRVMRLYQQVFEEFNFV